MQGDEIDVFDDVARLKEVIRSLLERIELVLATPLSMDAKTLELQIGLYDRFFGAKVTLASTLTTLADLLLKLDAIEGEKQAALTAMPSGLSDADVALVEAFVHKMRQTETL